MRSQDPTPMSTQFSENDPRLAGAALRALSEISIAWSLTNQEQLSILGQPIEGDLAGLFDGADGALPQHLLERISYLIGIYRALHIIFPNRLQADEWVRRPNVADLFEGGSALAFMCSGRVEDLALVRMHLEAGGQVDSDIFG